MKRNRTILIGIIVLTIVVGLLFTSYAYFNTQIFGNSGAKLSVFKNNPLTITYSDDTNEITGDATDSFTPGSTITKTFTLTNPGTTSFDYSVTLDNITNTFTRTQDITYTLALNGTNVVTDTFPSETKTVVYNETILAGETISYILTIKYKTSTENQSGDSGAVIGAKLVFDYGKESTDNLIIYGNSIQNGTPTPANPIEVLNVGDKSNNLFNPSTAEYTGCSYSNGVITATAGTAHIDIALPAGTYTISGTNTQNIFVRNGKVTSGFIGTKQQSDDSITVDFTGSVDGYMRISFFGGTIKDLQIESGSYKTPYIPYGMYRVSYNLIGKNWFNANDDFSDVPNYPSGNGYYGHKIKLKANTTYTISTTANNRNYFVNLTKDDWYKGNSAASNILWLSDTTDSTSSYNLSPGTPKTFTTGDTGNIWINMAGADTASNFKAKLSSCFTNLQIEEGETATQFEEYIETPEQSVYLPRPLMKVGNYADYIDIKRNVYVRHILKWGASTLNSKYSSGSQYANGLCRFQFGVTGFSADYTVKPLSNVATGHQGNIIQTANHVTSSSQYSNVYWYLSASDVGLEPVSAVTSNNTIGSAIKDYVTANNMYILLPISIPITYGVTTNSIDLNTYGGEYINVRVNTDIPPYKVEKTSKETRNDAVNYTELEYIENTGPQYIDTQIYFDFSKDFIVEGSFINPNASVRKIILGNYYDSNSVNYNLEIYSNGKLRSYFQPVSSSTLNLYSTNALPANTLVNYTSTYSASTHKVTNQISYGSTSFSYNGTVPTSTATSKYALKFFLDNRESGASTAQNPLKLGRTKVYQGGNLIGDFIPVKSSNNEVGLYDTITRRFLTNSGTGSFNAGPEVSS